jgi:hypothetical protein
MMSGGVSTVRLGIALGAAMMLVGYTTLREEIRGPAEK